MFAFNLKTAYICITINHNIKINNIMETIAIIKKTPYFSAIYHNELINAGLSTMGWDIFCPIDCEKAEQARLTAEEKCIAECGVNFATIQVEKAITVFFVYKLDNPTIGYAVYMDEDGRIQKGGVFSCIDGEYKRN